MNKLILLIPFVVFLSACTFFNVNQLEEGTYEIKGHATALKREAIILKEMKKKAAKVCKGNGFDVVEPGTAKINKNYSGNPASTSRTVTLTVKCKS